MNWEKGLKRFALVLAVVVGMVHCSLLIAYGGSWLDRLFGLISLESLGSPASDWAGLLIAFLIGFLPVWGHTVGGLLGDERLQGRTGEKAGAAARGHRSLWTLTREIVAGLTKAGNNQQVVACRIHEELVVFGPGPTASQTRSGDKRLHTAQEGI